jgi:hypothetical protein
MIREFNALNDYQCEMMLKAPILVCILIAGADGNIDRKEIHRAISLASEKRESQGVLGSYFNEVFHDFEDKLKILIQSYPYESTQRTPLLVQELSEINSILNQLDPSFAESYYSMLLELAQKIAKSSGGWFGMKSIGAEEAKYVTLPMIQAPSKNS